MTFDELCYFITEKMKMSHVYQPLMIKCLLASGGSSTLRQLAIDFVREDEALIGEYERTIKDMPLRVLRKHGVVDRDGDLVSLCVNKLTLEQRAEITLLCEQRLQKFIRDRGLKIWDYRLLDDPVPETLRYRVLVAGDRRCALCGTTKDQGPLHVDHIVPRSKGGMSTIDNLQVLCSKCNLDKSNRDDTDLREMPPEEIADCVFCIANISDRIFEECESVVAIRDQHPVTAEHTLIIPKRHTADFFTMSEAERRDANDLLRLLKGRIPLDDPTVTGFNVGMNCGESAGQTVAHAHLHLIPRRDGDINDPRGGVRGVIPSKRVYTL
jgi:ATP adenylyltransferase